MHPLRLTAALLLLLACTHLCAGNLMGVDLGTSYVKVAVARPGKGLELVTNEQAKRKTPAAVGFTHEEERLFGDAAIAYSAKAPERVILDGRNFLGVCDTASGSDMSATCARQRQSNFTGEEIVAMLLAMARRQASAFLGGAVIKDVAVTVPAWFDEKQRLAVFDAARIIGLNCLGVINANTAAAIKYALDGKARPADAATPTDKKGKPLKTVTQRVLFYDIGAGSASASVIELVSTVKTGLTTAVRVLSHASERGVNGRLLDGVIIDTLADAFDALRAKNGGSFTPARELPRVMMRLRKESQRAREMLSANTEAFVSIGSLHEDTDLKTQLYRADFETAAKPMIDLVGRPAKAALSSAGLTSKDIDGVVPFGGISRTPAIQDALVQALGIPALNKSLNTDEAAVMGSVFFAASMSSTFRVRKLDVEDVYTRGVSMEIEREASSGGLFSGSGKKKAPQVVEVFPDTGSKLPSKKTVSLNRNADFSFSIYLNADKTGLSRFSQRTLFAKVNVKGVADVLAKMKDKKKSKSTTPRVALSFHLDKSGLVRIGTAESSADETVVVEREVEVKDEKEDKKKSKKGDDNKNEKKSEETASASPESTESESASPESSGEETEAEAGKKDKKKKTKIETSTQTVVHRHALTVEFVEGEGLQGAILSGSELDTAQAALKALETADLERVERQDAYNALEGFILEARSRVRAASDDEDDTFHKVSTAEARDALVSALDDAEDWMYTDEARDLSNLRKKHHELQSSLTPIEERAAELERRPKAAAALRSAVEDGKTRVATLRTLHADANSTHLDDFDKFPALCLNVTTWLDDVLDQVSKQDLTENPAVTAKEIKVQTKLLNKEVARLVKLDIPVVQTVQSADPAPDADDKANATETDAADPDVDTDKSPPNPDADSAQADSASTSSKDEL